MSCKSCTTNVLKTFLTRFDVVFPSIRIAGETTHPLTRIYPKDSLSSATRISCRSIQRRFFLTGSGRSFPLRTDEKENPASAAQRKKPTHDEGAGFSGIGLAGQQSKDLQEQVSSIALLEGSSRSIVGEQKKSPSTPARLARRERRMPSRRFKGDRARPETKEKDSSKPVSRKKGNQIRNQSLSATTRKKATGLSRTESADKAFIRQLEETKPRGEHWGTQKSALEKKFGETGWMPRKRLSPDALDGIRALHGKYPDTYTTPVLAQHFKVSPENIRRILKSKWRPNEDEEEERRRRWEKRGEDIWTDMAAKGVKPPKPWREKGIGRLSDRRSRSPNFAVLEEQISREYAKDVVTTRAVGV